MRKLLTFALLAVLASSCARRIYWSGFHGPAYLPAKPRPAPAK